MDTPNGYERFQGGAWTKKAGLQIEPELDDLHRWEDEGGKIANHVFEWGEVPHTAEVDPSNVRGARRMPIFKIGDTVVHSTFGSGKIIAIADKGLPDEPCFYYVIENSDRTLWVPVEENGRSSLHLPVSPSDFKLLINILRSRGEKMSNNPYQRRERLNERMQKASAKDLCLVIRDLTHSPRRRKLSQSDIRVLKHAQSLLLDEWERSLGTPREKAGSEMKSILNDRR